VVGREVTELTSIERQILRLISIGLKRKTISLKIGRTARTVEYYYTRIRKKLGAATIPHAMKIALERGVLEWNGRRVCGLSPREQGVLRRLADGAVVKHIAREMRISPRTAEVHIRNARVKLHAASAAEAAFLVSGELIYGGDKAVPGL
jgi:DNA-binding NarL/FixJ family response regulator